MEPKYDKQRAWETVQTKVHEFWSQLQMCAQVHCRDGTSPFYWPFLAFSTHFFLQLLQMVNVVVFSSYAVALLEDPKILMP